MPKSLQGLSLLGTYSTVCLQKCIQESLIESVLEQHCAEAHHSRGNITRAVSLLADPLTRAGSCAPFLIHKRIQEKYINAILFLLWKLLLLVIAGALLKNGIPSSHRWELHSAVLQLTCLEHTVNCSCQSWSLPEDDGFRWCPTSKDPKKGRDVIKEVEINTENPHFRSRRYWKHWWAVLENTWLVFLDACAVWLILMASFFFFFYLLLAISHLPCSDYHLAEGVPGPVGSLWDREVCAPPGNLLTRSHGKCFLCMLFNRVILGDPDLPRSAEISEICHHWQWPYTYFYVNQFCYSLFSQFFQ